jgi:hypothetical protein
VDVPHREESGPRQRWGETSLCCRLCQESSVQSLLKGEFRNELFTTMLRAARAVSSFQHKGLNKKSPCVVRRRQPTSYVCVTKVGRARAKCWVSMDKELAGKARELYPERLLVNSSLWLRFSFHTIYLHSGWAREE